MKILSLHRASRGRLAALAGAAAVLALSAFAPRVVVSAAAPPTVHVVRMTMSGTTARFEPATVTIHAGDQVRFVVASGAPHNVAFDPAKLPADVRRVLAAAMPNPIQPLSGALLLNVGDSYTISFAGVKPGRYEFFCMPHVGMAMKGTVVVR
ncbi:MAG TPA: plastocyanin/azurin family copper-binding protein [Longimicrobium sp.]|nr:plastocyanin/azurin family copper-binding protein [Longimicrobium sp.]